MYVDKTSVMPEANLGMLGKDYNICWKIILIEFYDNLVAQTSMCGLVITQQQQKPTTVSTW